MANLLARGLVNQDNEPNVEERLSQIENFVRNYKTEGGFQQLQDELLKIKQSVIRREMLFYKRMGVSDFEELNKKIKKIQNKYNALLPDGEIIRYVKQTYSFIGVAHASDEELQAATEEVLNDFLENIQEPLLQASLEEINGQSAASAKDAIIEFFQRNLQTETGKRFITSRGQNKVGLGRIISSYSPKKKKVKVSFNSKMKVSSTFRNKLETDLTTIYSRYNGNINDKITPQSREEYRAQINELIQQKIGSFTLLGIDTRQFDLNRSLASTIGYLGEIRAVAMLNELVPDEGYRAKGTGALRSIKTGQEIPIDVICKANGFQIKNYTLENNQVTLSGGQQVPYWVANRLQLSGEIAEVINELFGIYQYNQPLTHGNPPDLPEYEEQYDKIEGSIIYELTDVFNSRIPYMIKMAEEFAVKQEGSIFSNQQLYFNTFFWINKYLVPSSWIIDKLILALDKKNQNKIVDANYEFIKDQAHSPYRWQVMRSKKNASSYSSQFMAKLVKANYDITIDLSEFL